MKKFGRYEVIEVLGAGGMARVYRARDPRLGREVAVKVISLFVSDKDKSRERFSQEAAVMAQLAHPAIVPIHDFGEQDGHPYIVMRLMEGGSLADRLQQEGPLSFSEVTGLLERLAPALEMAHARGIVHRDLKPDNILLDQFGNPSIADFGLVKVLSGSIAWTKTNTMLGSPPYMSPQQALGQLDLDQQSDIYSLGVVVFEALTGKWPYDSGNSVGFGMMHNTAPIPNICDVNPNLPPGCKEVIERVLAKKPFDRYPSVTAFMEALKALQIAHVPTVQIVPPPNPVDYLSRGHQYYNQRQYDLAISQYNEAVRLRPNDPNALLCRGNAYYSKAEYDLAIADYTETLRISPNYGTAYYNRGNAYQYKRLFDLAIADYNQALRINPDNLTALLERGNVYFNKGQLDQAIADYDDALRINPNYAEAARKRQEAVRKRQEAIKKQQEAIRKQKETAEQKRRQQEAEARARQEAAQKAAAEQKRRQQEAEARARREAAQKAAAERKRRQQEAEARARREAAQKARAEQAQAKRRSRAVPRTIQVIPQVDKSQQLLKEVAQALATMRNHTLPPTVRAEAGRVLAQLGDPRPEVMTVKGMQFCLVPAAPFWMGNKPKPKSGWFSFLNREKLDRKNPPLHQVNLPYSYWISRYPVTNAQFLEFLKGGGYGYEPDWREAKAHGYWQNGRVKGYRDQKWRDRPHDFGAPYNLPNHPVVGVTWYEALAFTRWLTRRWSGSSPARLPTEAEWEKAARGGIEIPATALICPATNLAVPASFAMRQNRLPKRHYPWGNEFDSTYANSKESGIGKTNAVGCFVKGQTPYGCEEMSGNVWEWCQSLYEEYPYRPDDGRENLAVDASRVFRGGTHYTTKIGLRCFSRSRNNPSSGYDYTGFRVFRNYKTQSMDPLTSDL